MYCCKRQIVGVLLCLIFLSTFSLAFASVLQVTFSYNRPLQLNAFLCSEDRFIKGIDHKVVLYRADEEYAMAYTVVQRLHPEVLFVAQKAEHRSADFKPLLLHIFDTIPADYCIFAVDDNLVMRPVDLKRCITELEKTRSYGYYLRLGRNINRCYAIDKSTPAPNFKKISEETLSFYFKDGDGDWGYPNTVDMTLYRTADVAPLFQTMTYQNPNLLEGRWSGNIQKAFSYAKGLCPQVSAVTNLPLNRVQRTYNNRCENSISAAELLELFYQGYTFDIDDVAQQYFISPHVAYVPRLIYDERLIELLQEHNLLHTGNQVLITPTAP